MNCCCEYEALRLAREGDVDAAYALYEANLPLIRRIAAKHAHIDCAVGLDDLMQEGYLATLEAAEAYGDDRWSWAQTLAWALKRRYARLFPKRRPRAVSIDRAPSSAVAAQDRALVRMEIREALRASAAACGGETTAQVILAHDLEGETLRSIADRLGLNYATMCQGRRRTLKRMRRATALRGEGVDK